MRGHTWPEDSGAPGAPTGIERRGDGGERSNAGRLDLGDEGQDIAGELVCGRPVCRMRLHGNLGGARIAQNAMFSLSAMAFRHDSPVEGRVRSEPVSEKINSGRFWTVISWFWR